MAGILDRYGIKEVADVTFYALNDSGNPSYPVLYLDTLKVSTIEQTAEQTEARGGKGNPPLIIWDYGKEINVTLEDALFSAKSMAIMFGNGQVKNFETAEGEVTANSNVIMKTMQFIAAGSGDAAAALPTAKRVWTGPDGKEYTMINPRFYSPNTGADGKVEECTTFVAGERYFVTFDVKVKGSVIEISANTFPGTYYVTGDTYARNEASGRDEFFQFIIPKAKVQSENTITLEAEGDPSVFNMSLRVMRPADGVMMKLVKYDALEGTAGAETSAVIVHNHGLDPQSAGPEEVPAG